MQSLGQILQNLSRRRPFPAAAADRAPELIPEPPCPRCQGAGWLALRRPLGDPEFGGRRPCPACPQTAAETPAATVPEPRPPATAAGPGPLLQPGPWRPEGPRTDRHSQRLYQAAWTRIEEYAAAGFPGGLTLTGPPGSGKTAAAATLRDQARQQGREFECHSLPNLLEAWRQSYGETPAAANPAPPAPARAELQEAELLILDDLNPRTWTPWVEEQLFLLLEARSQTPRATVLLLDGRPERLPEKLRQRLERSYGFHGGELPLAAPYSAAARAVGEMPPQMLRERTFAAFHRTTEPPSPAYAAWAAAQKFAANPQGWLLISGPPNRGKSHLAAAVAGEQLQQGRLVFAAAVAPYIESLQQAMEDAAPAGLYAELLELPAQAELLILEDLGQHHLTPWRREKLQQILLERYDRRRPTLLTAPDPRQLAEALPQIGSRLHDSSRISTVRIR